MVNSRPVYKLVARIGLDNFIKMELYNGTLDGSRDFFWFQPFFGLNWFKGGSDPSHFIFENNVGKSRILSRSRSSAFYFRVVVCRLRLYPTLISKIKWLRSGLPLKNNPSESYCVCSILRTSKIFSILGLEYVWYLYHSIENSISYSVTSKF